MKNHNYLIFLAVTIITVTGCGSSKPAAPADLLELSIAEIHRYYEEGVLTSRQLTEFYLERIGQLDDSLNAITTINPNALAIADELDREFAGTRKLRPLHGIPIIVKDNINTKGLPTTGGSLALKDFIPKEDAFIIRRLVEAGAIIIAKSNMAEWAFSPMHTESSTGGTTRNPYNIDYVPAGSSGGTASAIAADFATGGLGTDTGNSIRGPSSHCSLVGFRTTIGLISRSGIIPLYLRNDVVGPMCRTVEDATRMLEVMAGYDPSDPVTAYSNGKVPENYTQFLEVDGLKGSRIGVMSDITNYNLDPEIEALFDQAIIDMKSLGAQIVDSVYIKGFNTLKQNQWCSDFRKDVEAYLTEFVRNDTMKSIEDIIRVGTKSKFAEERLKEFSGTEGRWNDPGSECLDPYTDTKRIAFREAIERVMDSLDLDVLVYPSWNNRPATISAFDREYRGDNNQIIVPHTGQPAFTVPMGYTTGNLPVGVQFLGRMYDEPTLIKLAYSYEQGTMHRKPPELKIKTESHENN